MRILASAILLTFVAYANAAAPNQQASTAERTYLQRCVNCHARDGSGNNAQGKKLKVRDLRSPEVQKMSDADLLNIIAKGKGQMPGYEKQMDAAARQEMLQYIRQMAPKN